MAEYQSTHTGAQIDAAVSKATDLPTATELADTYATKTEVTTGLAGKQGTLTVNPATTTGTLSSIGINGTNYAVGGGGGGAVHLHTLRLDSEVVINFVCDKDTTFGTKANLAAYLYSKGWTSSSTGLPINSQVRVFPGSSSGNKGRIRFLTQWSMWSNDGTTLYTEERISILYVNGTVSGETMVPSFSIDSDTNIPKSWSSFDQERLLF